MLAESAAIAESAAKLVTVRYEELPAIMTIEDAIAAERHVLCLIPGTVCTFLISILDRSCTLECWFETSLQSFPTVAASSFFCSIVVRVFAFGPPPNSKR